VRVALAVGVLVVTAVLGRPQRDRALDGHATRDHERDAQGAAALEGAVGEEPVVADGDAEDAHEIHDDGDHHITRADAPAPGGGQGEDEKQDGQHHEHDQIGGAAGGGERHRLGRGRSGDP
jgi:hypothetical protein